MAVRRMQPGWLYVAAFALLLTLLSLPTAPPNMGVGGPATNGAETALAPGSSTTYPVNGTVVASVNGYGPSPTLVGVNVSASSTTCSTERPLPTTCPLVNWTTTNASGEFSMNVSAGTFFIAAHPDGSVTGGAYPYGFGGTSTTVTVGSPTVVRLVVSPFVPYGNTSIVLPEYTCDWAYLDDRGTSGPGCQNPVLSWTQDGAYYLSTTNELVFYSFVNRTVRDLSPWTPLYQRFPSYAMIPNELFLTQDGTFVYGWGTLSVGSNVITAEAVNTSTDRRFLYNFTGISIGAVATNGQVQLTGWDGNDSVLTLLLASGALYAHDLWTANQSYVATFGFFEANNVYWEPYLNAYIDVEAGGSSDDVVQEWQLTGPSGYTLRSTFDASWGSGRLINGVNGIALNVTDRTLMFALGSSEGVNAVVANLDGSGTITGFSTVIEGPAGGAQLGPAAASDRPTILTTGPALQGYYNGFYNASWLLEATPGHIGVETTNLSGAYSYGGSPAMYGWSQWSQEGQFYNASYLIAPNSYSCDREFLDVCSINGTGGVPVGTIWWYWQLGAPEFPYPESAAVADTVAPSAANVTSSVPTDSSLTLAWTPARAVRFYLLDWGTTEQYGRTVLLSSGTVSYTLVGLVAGTEYDFTLEAWNLHGRTESVGISSSVTLGLPPPTGLVFTAATNSTISWAWTQSVGPSIVNNTLYLFGGANCEGAARRFSTGGPATSETTSGLAAGTQYSAFVTSWSSVSQSNGSACKAAQTLSASAVAHPVTFVETGLPSADAWYVNISNGPSLVGTGNITSAMVALPNGTYAFSAETNDKRYSSGRDTSFQVLNAPLTVDLTFAPVLYPVTFGEVGLPPGTVWAVSVAANEQNSSSNQVTFEETNGTYAYSILDQPGWHETNLTYSGTFGVNGEVVTEPTAEFARVVYNVTFQQLGLPDGTVWSVDIAGDTVLSAESSIAFPLANGSYPVAVNARGSYRPTEPSGVAVVDGKNMTRPTTFVAVPLAPPQAKAGGTPWWPWPSEELYAVIAGGAAAIVLGVATMRKLRRSRP